MNSFLNFENTVSFLVFYPPIVKIFINSFDLRSMETYTFIEGVKMVNFSSLKYCPHFVYFFTTASCKVE